MITYFLLHLKEMRRFMGHGERCVRPWVPAGVRAAGLPQRINTKVPRLSLVPRAELPEVIKPVLGTALGTELGTL